MSLVYGRPPEAAPTSESRGVQPLAQKPQDHVLFCFVAPALHALIIGVSAYPHLPGGDGPPAPDGYGLTQLTAAARSAMAVRNWLDASDNRLSVPLGNCTTLLSPSPGEMAFCKSAAGLATRDEVSRALLDWRDDCASDPDNLAFFYFAGHGVQRTRTDAALLLSDFADRPGNPLVNAIDINNLVNGMAPTVKRPGMARTQMWFIDACRVFPSQFDSFERLSATEVFDVTLSDRDNRCAPVYFGSLPGGEAFALPGDQTIFSKALIECMNGAAGVLRPGSTEWDVTVGSLSLSLEPVVRAINAETGGSQVAWTGGQMTKPGTRIVTAPGVPDVRVSLELRPSSCAHEMSLRVTCPKGNPMPVPIPLNPNPFCDRWPAGVYRFDASPSDRGLVDGHLPVLPPEFPWVGEVLS